jgi:EcoEI R protein C-terminal
LRLTDRDIPKQISAALGPKQRTKILPLQSSVLCVKQHSETYSRRLMFGSKEPCSEFFPAVSGRRYSASGSSALIEEQLLREVVVDRASIDEEPFRADGGFQRLNKVFGGQLEAVLSDISEELWKKAA